MAAARTDDEPDVTFQPPHDATRIRAYIRDPDGHLIEVGQATGILHALDEEGWRPRTVGTCTKRMGMTEMDLLDLLGSVVAPPRTTRSRAVGALIHHMNGAILAVSWAYAAHLVNAQLNWVSAAIWGVVLWALALLMLSTIGAVHPAIRRGQQDDPGKAATSFGPMTPVGSLMGHLVWGIVLGLLYSTWPSTPT